MCVEQAQNRQKPRVDALVTMLYQPRDAQSRCTISGSERREHWFCSPAKLICSIFNVTVEDSDRESVMRCINWHIAHHPSAKLQKRSKHVHYARDVETDRVFKIERTPQHFRGELSPQLAQVSTAPSLAPAALRKLARPLMQLDDNARRTLPSANGLGEFESPQRRVVEIARRCTEFADGMAWGMQKAVVASPSAAVTTRAAVAGAE